MAAPDSYRADIPAEVNNFYDTLLLVRALPLNIHGLFGQKRSIPAGAGSNVIKFRRYGSLASATSAITDGVTPTGKSLSVTDITATALQYGDFTRISDNVTTQSPDPVLTEATAIFGEQMGLTNDELTRDILGTGTVVAFCSASHSAHNTLATGDKITVTYVKAAVTTLKIAKARKITSMSSVNPGVGSIPVNACFVGICHPSTSALLKAETGWNSVQTYASNVTPFPGEIGSLDEVRFIESTNAKIVLTNAVFNSVTANATIDVYFTTILAADAYGIVDLANSQGNGVIYKGLGSAGSADPLDQRQTLGWKEYFVAKILNDAFMVRLEHTIS
jgi:N4-gp56 family major capsid protein